MVAFDTVLALERLNFIALVAANSFNCMSINFVSFLHIFRLVILNFIVAESAGEKF